MMLRTFSSDGRLLSEAGAHITVYDPVAMDNFHARFPDIRLAASAEEALTDASLCFVFTEWDEVKRLTAETFKQCMRVPLVYDGRNIFDPDTMRQGGVEYHSIGR